VAKHTIAVRRIYEDPDGAGGYRVLVDRLWPRGLTKERVHVDAWLKGLAPSNELRRWYGHALVKWPEFQRRYRIELDEPARQEQLAALVQRARSGAVTLLCGAKDAAHSQAEVIRAVLEERLRD
jgi:uncharacterized protein YeaO (DUF488 family)